MTPLEIESELIKLSAELLIEADKSGQAARDYKAKENDYRRAKAIAFLNSEGTVDARKAKVDVACEDVRLKAHLAEAEYEAGKQKVYALQAAITAYQTIAKFTLAEFNLSNSLSTGGQERALVPF